MKLSAAQIEMLKSAVDGHGGCSEAYPPAKKLVTLGLCTGQCGSYGSYRLVATDDGHRALSEIEKDRQ